MKQMLTRGEAQVLRAQGESMPINLMHPANRFELRDEYRRMPRKVRVGVFGRWRNKRQQFAFAA